MTLRLDGEALRLQRLAHRNHVIETLARWFIAVLPPGVVPTHDVSELARELRKVVAQLDKQGIKRLELQALVLTAMVCIGEDYEQHYPAASQVLHSRYLDQEARARWYQLFLDSFPYLHGERFRDSTPSRSALPASVADQPLGEHPR